MANIPLNYFTRKAYTLSTTLSSLYTAPFDRASIVLAAYATNLTLNDVTVTLGLSGVGAQFVPIQPYVDYAKNILISGNDTTSLVPSKLVLQQYDTIIASCNTPNAVILNLSILETLNTIT